MNVIAERNEIHIISMKATFSANSIGVGIWLVEKEKLRMSCVLIMILQASLKRAREGLDIRNNDIMMMYGGWGWFMVLIMSSFIIMVLALALSGVWSSMVEYVVSKK